jgi:hypothetical protein
MASISVRNNGPNGDPLWGQNQLNFLTDLQAVTQLIQQRLLLFLGEWFANLNDGTPYFQTILGRPANMQAINLALTQRILGTAFVSSVLNVESTFNTNSQLPFGYGFTATVQTQFGVVSVTNIPTPIGQGIPQ